MLSPFERISSHGVWTTCVVWTRTREGQSFDAAPGFPGLDELGLMFEASPELRKVAAVLPDGAYRFLVEFQRGVGGNCLLVRLPSWTLAVDGGEPVHVAEWFDGAQLDVAPEDLQAVLDLLPGRSCEVRVGSARRSVRRSG